MNLDAGLRRSRGGLRFAEPATERDFQVWRAEKAAFLVWVGGATSAMGWMLSSIGIFFWLPEVRAQTLPVTASVVLGFMLVTPILAQRGMRRWRIPCLTLIVMTTGLLQLWLFLTTGEPLIGFAMALSSGIAMVILNSFFASVMHLPAINSLVTTIPALSVSVLLSVDGYGTGVLDRYIVGLQVGFCSLTIVTVFLICLLIEQNSRREFVKTKIIENQQERIQLSATLVRRYVPPTVARHIFEGDPAVVESPKRLRVTILFADVVGFTPIADRVEPEVMTEIMNDYISAMAGIVEAHGGTLNEFAGDGIMALFGAPDPLPPALQVAEAVRAAQQMHRRMEALSDAWRTLGIDTRLKIRIGINTGVVSVGSYGSPGRMTYTAVGVQTNIAARLEACAEPGETLISNSSYLLLRNEVACAQRGEVECKGVHYPVPAYSPLEAGADQAAAAELVHAA